MQSSIIETFIGLHSYIVTATMQQTTPFCECDSTSSAQGTRRSKYPELRNENWLRQKYLTEELSSIEIAKIVGCTSSAVQYAMNRFGISARKLSDVKRKCRYAQLDSKEWVYEHYSTQELSLQKVADIVGDGCTSGAIYGALKRFGIAARSHSETSKGEKNSFYDRHHTEATKQRISEAKKGTPNVMKGKRHTAESRKNMSDAHQGDTCEHLKEHQFKTGCVPWNKDKQGVYSEEMLKWMSEVMIGRFAGEKHPFYGKHHTEEAKRINGEKHLGNSHSEEVKKVILEASKRNWRDPEFIKKWVKGVHAQPNKPESKVDQILQKHFPDEWKYNGDFSCGVTVDGMIPDFVNVNGKKMVIEVFGEVFHDPDKTFRKSIPWKQQEFGRISTYSQFGYGCVIFWDYELKDDAENLIVNRLKEECNM